MAQFIDESHARKAIERWQASGLGIVEFTKREGISVGKFYRMRAVTTRIISVISSRFEGVV